MPRYIEWCGKGEKMRETTVRHISKEAFDHFNEDKKFIDFITDELTKEISERIIQALEALAPSGEIIVKKPVMSFSEFRPTCSVEFRKTVEWEPLVRCKDCKWFNDLGCAIRIVDESDKPKEDDFCSFGERRNDD